MTKPWDAVVVGSGPNGLSAAITFARAGRSVLVLESNDRIGGALASAELTEPGFIHDVGSAIHPLGIASPFFRSLDLERYGLEWVMPPAAVAHPLDGGDAAIAWHDLERTIAGLGVDGDSYRAAYAPLVAHQDELLELVLSSVLRIPRHPVSAARFGLQAAFSANAYARLRFDEDRARALFAGHAAHAILPLTRPLTAALGLMFGTLAHGSGWPFPRGGAQELTNALAACLTDLGGEIRTGTRVATMADLPPAKRVVFALTPRQVLSVTGEHFPHRYRRALGRFRYGPGAFKVDYALDAEVPWANADVAEAGTVHLGGRLEEIVAAEAEVAAGRVAARPYVLAAQHTRFDPSRAPAGKHTFWAYCHVPHGFVGDALPELEGQIERFAPGFRDVVRARHITTPAALEAQNANLVGGDVGGGSQAGAQIILRPRLQVDPWATADPRIFIGSASTTPGAGVHGMAGHHAAISAMRP